MISLGPNARNGDKISKDLQDFVFFGFVGNSTKRCVINTKCPSFDQMSIFLGLVFCKQVYIYISNNLWALMEWSFVRAPLFQGARRD